MIWRCAVELAEVMSGSAARNHQWEAGLGLYQPLACGNCSEGLLELLHMGEGAAKHQGGLVLGVHLAEWARPRSLRRLLQPECGGRHHVEVQEVP